MLKDAWFGFKGSVELSAQGITNALAWIMEGYVKAMEMAGRLGLVSDEQIAKSRLQQEAIADLAERSPSRANSHSPKSDGNRRHSPKHCATLRNTPPTSRAWLPRAASIHTAGCLRTASRPLKVW
ncbi:MAG: hypothetical protein MZV65_28660 [Chromatiales bacterium]|nr:hypothetical protein [Chromatiales bacterium]